MLDKKAPFPLSGPIPDKDYSFTIEYDSENLEYPENRNLRNPGEMAEYNRANNKDKGIERIRERFTAATGGTLKPGDKITTAQLKEWGYTNPNAITRLVTSKTITRVQKGIYVVNSV